MLAWNEFEALADEIERLRRLERKMATALKRIKHWYDLNDCHKRRDDDALEIPIADLRAACNALKRV